MKKILGTFISLFFCIISYATHQVAGYIAVKWIGGYTYQVTIYDYTNTYPNYKVIADRDTMRLWWFDGGLQSHLCYRINGRSNYLIPGDTYPNGEPLCNYNLSTDTPTPLNGARKVNIYQTDITFNGPAYYRVWMDDPDRMANINNIVGSVNVYYYMYSYINVVPIGDLPDSTGISSLLITNTPVCQYGCVGQCYTYNPGAYIPDLPPGVADSIGYSLGPCLELVNPTDQLSVGIATSYYNPGATINDSGTFKWCPDNMSDIGIWNFAIKMTTYIRMSSYGVHYMQAIDTTEMELEVIINSVCYTPTVTSLDTCVTAGDNLSITYTATVPDKNPLYISASGQPFQETPPATLRNYTPPLSTMHPVLNWQTTCNEVSDNPYEVVIKATEKVLQPPNYDSAFYSGYGTSRITVVAPAPQHLTAVNKGTTVCLSWQNNGCPQDTIYNIYRRKGCSGWKHQFCETGVPSYTGFVLIAKVHGVTSYCDDNAGAGLSPGVTYDYIVDAALPPTNGAQSYASNDTCITIKLGVPLITNVSVTKTDPANGEIFIRWMKPIADAADLDTTVYPPPYKYVLERASGMNGTHFSILAADSTTVFKTTIDTTYSDKGLDTKDSSYTYKVDFYYGVKDTFIGSSGNASSLYLRLLRDDKSMHMGWSAAVPWTNDTFYIYRENPPPATQVYQRVGKTTNTTYTDTGLHNGSTYCYYVESYSEYTGASKVPKPLFDSSETACGIPEDTIPPCAPPLVVTAKCVLYDDSLIWSNPDRQCPKANKVVSYQIYYTPVENGDMHIIDTIDNPKDTIFVNSHLTSVAGCYAVVAVDSAGQTSPLNTQCVDNCPIYELPNVFTPNGDGKNDLFTPLATFRFIQGIDISIYNRWGQVVYHTTDPYINWNGNVDNSGGPCPDGVYYYIGNVNEIRVTGLVSIPIKGFIELIRN